MYSTNQVARTLYLQLLRGRYGAGTLGTVIHTSYYRIVYFYSILSILFVEQLLRLVELHSCSRNSSPTVPVDVFCLPLYKFYSLVSLIVKNAPMGLQDQAFRTFFDFCTKLT